MNLKSVILGIIVVIILVVLYYWLFTDQDLNNIITLKDASMKDEVDAKTIPNVANFSYSLWVFVKQYNYNYGQKKYILFRPVQKDTITSNDCYYCMYFDQYQSDLVFKLKEADTSNVYASCKIEDIPLQKWTHVLVSYRNRAIDMYVDGKLSKTCTTMKNYDVPAEPRKLLVCPSNADVKDGSSVENGFKGFLGSVRHYSRAIQPREAYAIYKEGYNGGSWLSDMFNKYKLKIAFMEDQKELNSILL